MSNQINNKVANLPYPALANIMNFACQAPSSSMKSFGSVCKNWRAILEVTNGVWDRFVAQRWPNTPAKDRNFEMFMARAKNIDENLRPIKMRNTTPIEECEFAFKCPMMLENLKLVEPAVSGGSGPVYFCDTCNKNVYTVRTEAEKQQCALDRKCVVFNRYSAHPSTSLRHRVALVTNDETEADRLAAPAKAKKALAEIRAVADADNSPSTVSVVDRLIVELVHQGSWRKVKAVSEFRHVPKSHLIDPSTPGHVVSSTVINPTTGKKERPFIPDVILYLDDPSFPPNFSEGATALSIRFGETGAVASFFDSSQQDRTREPVAAPVMFNPNFASDSSSSALSSSSSRLDLSILCDPSSGEWILGDPDAVKYGKVRRSASYTFNDFTMFLMMPNSSLKTAVAKGQYSAEDSFAKYLEIHPEMDLRNRKPGQSGIFLRPVMEKPTLATCGKIRPHTGSIGDFEISAELIANEGAGLGALQEYPVFEVFVSSNRDDDNDEPVGVPTNFFFLAAHMLRFIKICARANDSRIEKFVANSARKQSRDEDLTRMNHAPTIYHSFLPTFICVPIAPNLSPFTSYINNNNSNNNNNNNNTLKSLLPSSSSKSREEIAQTAHYSCAENSTRVKEILAAVGLDMKAGIKKESNMAALGVDLTSEITQGNELATLQFRFGSTSSTVEAFFIEDGILESIELKFIDNDNDSDKENRFCGNRLDQILFEYILEHHVKKPEFCDRIREQPIARNRLLAACEAARIRLSTCLETRIEVDALVPGDSDFDLELKLTRPRLDFVFENEYRRLSQSIRNALQQIGSSSSRNVPFSNPDNIERICLSGSLSATPRVTSLLESMFQNVPVISNSNYHSVRNSSSSSSSSTSSSTSPFFKYPPSFIASQGNLVLGLRRGILGSQLRSNTDVFKAGYTCGMSAMQALDAAVKKKDEASSMLLGILDVVVLSIGASDASTGTMITAIERNRMYPTRKTIALTGRQLYSVPNSTTGATTSEIRIFEGERVSAADNHKIGHLQFPEAVHPESSVEVAFDLDANGILIVSATDSMNDANTVNVVITNDVGRMSADEINQMVRDAERMIHEDTILKEKVDKKNKIETAVYMLRNFLNDHRPPVKNTNNANDDDDDDTNKHYSTEEREKLEKLCQEAIKWVSEVDLDKTPLDELIKYFDKFENQLTELMNVAKLFPELSLLGAGSPSNNSGMPSDEKKSALKNLMEQQQNVETEKARANQGPRVEEVD